jgi:LacI family transcriptional regulator
VCNCDEVAYYFIQDLEKKGFSVPKDVSIVAFDNYIYSKLSRPQITTVQVEVEEMALEAARGLIHKIKDNQYRVGRKVIEGKLIARESVRKITRH